MARRVENLSLEFENMMNKEVLHTTGALVGPSLAADAWTQAKTAPHACLASDLIGMKVVSQEGDSLGKIEDVVVHPNGAPSYAVLSFGGWLGMGDKLFAMPWRVLRMQNSDTAKKDGERGVDLGNTKRGVTNASNPNASPMDGKCTIVLPVTKERFKTAPGFDKNSWPNTAMADWSKDVDTFYAKDLSSDARRPVEASLGRSSIAWRATELKGADVKNAAGEDLGDIQEIAIDANGRVSYVTLSVGGFLGIGDRLVAVPFDSLKFSRSGDKSDKKLITLATTKEQLERAPEFKRGKDHSAAMCDPKWIGQTYEYYSVPGYWDTTAQRDIKPAPRS